MKTAIVARIVAISLVCPDCGGACYSPYSESYIVNQDDVQYDGFVRCEDCEKEWDIPKRAFVVSSTDKKAMKQFENGNDPEVSYA